MEAEQEKDRGSGRTTQQLEYITQMLYDGKYKNVFYVVHHRDFIRYCMALIQKHTFLDPLYEVTRSRVCFRNKKGELVHITFVTQDREGEATRGFRDPIGRDHYVIDVRGDVYKHGTFAEQLQYDLLIKAGLEPWSLLYIPE